MKGIQTQEELAALFSRNLSLNPHIEKAPIYVVPVQNVEPPACAAVIQNPISYSVSQHYTHSAHIAKAQQPQTDQATVEIILARHGVDIATLVPIQLALFKSAEPAQQMRLIELWRISPPSYGGHAVTWQTTSLEQEEAMAKMRYDSKMQEQQQSQGQNQNTGMEQDRLIPMQGGDGRWSGSDLPQTAGETEPYMQSGYEQLARREYEASSVYSHFGTGVGDAAYNPATDPVYNIIPNSGPEWQQRQHQAMENQHGAFQQTNFAGTRIQDFGYGADDDMEML